MALNWRDIQDRTITFVDNYKDAQDEDRDAKPFWKDIFALFDIDPRTIGSFEERVRMNDRPGVGKMDYFAPKRFLIEQKTRGKDLELAYKQAMDYFDALTQSEKPRYIIICDFERFHIYDLEAKGKKRKTEILLTALAKNIKKLSFLADKEVVELEDERLINVKAVRAIGKLHHALKDSKYPSEDLSSLLTRIVFCCFADDTGIFEKNSLRTYFMEQTKEEGSDVGAHLMSIFDVLNTPESARQTTIHETLLGLPYVNGGLFAQPIRPVFSDRSIRNTLLECFAFDWSNVSPAIFGSMFQSVLDGKERHDLGAHYTSEENILKVIRPLFLDEIKEELTKAKNEEKLRTLWNKISTITLLDPACGCGNFLVISYRELRRLEIEIIKRLDKGRKGYVEQVDAGQAHLGLEMDLAHLSKMSVERMYGIEIESFPAEVAKLSLWLMDHVMNMELGAYYGKPLRKLPLKEAPHIAQGNALRMNWEDVVPKEKLSYILGNPPFLGARVMDTLQKEDIQTVFEGLKNVGNLDYVAGWYKKASEYIDGTHITCAFVSTNSITQGEQVGILWKYLIQEKGVCIHFAHRTFKWSNEASGKAAVFCVIVGFGVFDIKQHKLFSYKDIRGEADEKEVKHINPYLVEAVDVFLENRNKPLSKVPEIGIGNQPIDGGFYLFSVAEREEFLVKEPNAKKYFRRWVGSDEFLNGRERWCLYLGEVDPGELRSMPNVLKRIEEVRDFRNLSKRKSTLKLSQTPTRFQVENIPKGKYLIVPEVSSERRYYIPIGFEAPTTLASNLVSIISNATLYHFGVLESLMHMTWVRAVAGRLKSDYRYSKGIVYNNFPWPVNVSEEKIKCVEVSAQGILDVRKEYPNATLADLYDPNTMPKKLLDAHKALDRAVDACYGNKKFTSEPERLQFLFERYQELVDLLKK